MRFEWDESKNASNSRKHGIDFATAEQVFLDPLAFSEQDRFVDGEERWWTIGIAQDRLLYVAFTVREKEDEEVVRIISARGTTRKERGHYERGTSAKNR